MNPAELAYIQSDQAEMVVVDPQAPPRIRIRQLMRYSQVWALMTGYICRSMAGAFFLTWYPSYLLNERGFSEEAFGMVGAIPALAAVASTVLGGIVSDRLLASGRSADFARKVPIIGGLLISACIAFAPFLESDLAVMILLTVSNAAIQFSGAAVLSLPAEVAPSPDLVGSIAGFQNFGSQVGSIISPIAIGLFLTFSDGSYVGPLVLAGMSCIAGALVYGFWVKVKPVQTFTSTRSSTT